MRAVGLKSSSLSTDEIVKGNSSKFSYAYGSPLGFFGGFWGGGFVCFGFPFDLHFNICLTCGVPQVSDHHNTTMTFSFWFFGYHSYKLQDSVQESSAVFPKTYKKTLRSA